MRAIALAIATVGGIGRAPFAPGTWGSLAAVPVLPALGLLHARSAVAHVACVLAVVALGIWAAGEADAILGKHDHGSIVVDEVSGMLVASLCVPGSWTAAALVFLLFRLFDVWKPFPANRIDRRWSGGLGVVADDCVAGVYAGVAARALLEVL